MPADTQLGEGPRGFPVTRWTLIQASQDDPAARGEALRELLDQYWRPLYHLARRKGRRIEDAKDAVQGFLVHLLERDPLEPLDRKKGRFRSYLRRAFENHLINEHARASARKRGGGQKPLSLDFEGAEIDLAAAPSDPGAAFEKEWFGAIVERAFERLREEFESGRRQGPVEIAFEFFGFAEAPSYADASSRAGMEAGRFKAFLHRTRRRFRELMRDEALQTVPGAEEAESETQLLLERLGS